MEKIKHSLESDKGKDILIVIIVILVGLGSFELGRLSKESNTGGVKIEYTNQNDNQEASAAKALENTKTVNIDSGVQKEIQNSNLVGKNFFASSRGSKYYSLGCSAGKTIKQENRIYFTTGEEAQKAGYTLSSSCN